MLVKICGIRDGVSALVAAEAGADMLGFVFAPSRRRVRPEVVREARLRLAGRPVRLVGVFADAPLEEVRSIVSYCSLDYVQLCGSESDAYGRAIGVPVIKAIHVAEQGLPAGLGRGYDEAALVLFDTYDRHAAGGTGRAFDWSLLSHIRCERPFLLAGGLTPLNVGRAIDLVGPHGVDVSSGVETEGFKDPAKIVAFIQAAKTTPPATGARREEQ